VSTVLEFRSVWKQFGGAAVVKNVSLEVRPGEFFALIGPSGCGKTTTLRLVAGFEQPDSGAVVLNGVDVQGTPPYRRDVSTVFQNYALFPHLTVAENVAFGLRQRRHLAEAERNRRVSEMLDLVQLRGKEQRLPKQLSGGERQRVALARSLVLGPSVLLLDEPLSALDPQLRRHMRAELKALQKRVGVAFLFVTHDREEALALSDRVGVMNRGELLETGRGEDVYRKPRTRFAAEFLGDVNWMEPGCGVRPEAVSICCAPTRDTERCRAALAESIEFLGSRLRVRMRFEGGGIGIAESALNGRVPQAGERVWAAWRAEDEIRDAAD
jgi:ABC-type Fe3+/spermidine/putrescine transport system ATPase subunit